MTSRIGKSRLQNPRPCGAGFTLVEVLLAVVLLAGTAVFAIQGLAGVASALTIAEDRFNAYAFAASKLAELEIAVHHLEPLPETQDGSFRIGSRLFEWQVVVAPASFDPKLESMTLTVRWKEGEQPYENHFTTLRKILQEEGA